MSDCGRITTGHFFVAKEVVTAKKLNDMVNKSCINLDDILDDITDIKSDLLFLEARVSVLEGKANTAFKLTSGGDSNTGGSDNSSTINLDIGDTLANLKTIDGTLRCIIDPGTGGTMIIIRYTFSQIATVWNWTIVSSVAISTIASTTEQNDGTGTTATVAAVQVPNLGGAGVTATATITDNNIALNLNLGSPPGGWSFKTSAIAIVYN